MKKTIIILVIAIISITIILFTLLSPKDIEITSNMILTSPAFNNNERIPEKFTCDGQDINPQLDVVEVPVGTKSFALIMDDPDAPIGDWVHWIMYNIPIISQIPENSVPQGAIQGSNSWNRNSYGGPCPGSGTHRYMFKLYALDTDLDLKQNIKKQDIEIAMQNHILDQTVLTGTYSRN